MNQKEIKTRLSELVIYCDNSDHKGKHYEIHQVKMKDEFEGGLYNWCEKCIKKDGDMLAKIIK